MLDDPGGQMTGGKFSADLVFPSRSFSFASKMRLMLTVPAMPSIVLEMNARRCGSRTMSGAACGAGVEIGAFRAQAKR